MGVGGRMKRIPSILLMVSIAVIAAVGVAHADDPDRAADKRAAIDGMAREALLELFDRSEEATALFDRSAGYAVFDNFKVAVLLSGGGGVGVAVDRSDGTKTYMKMGTGGVGLGLGGQSYRVVFLFETEEALRRFVDRGWQADASANAAAGNQGKNASSSFSNGVAVFQITNKGLMAQADISGTKYWKARKLNAN